MYIYIQKANKNWNQIAKRVNSKITTTKDRRIAVSEIS